MWRLLSSHTYICRSTRVIQTWYATEGSPIRLNSSARGPEMGSFANRIWKDYVLTTSERTWTSWGKPRVYSIQCREWRGYGEGKFFLPSRVSLYFRCQVESYFSMERDDRGNTLARVYTPCYGTKLKSLSPLLKTILFSAPLPLLI